MQVLRLPTGTQIDLVRVGSYDISIAGASGVTVNSDGGAHRIGANYRAVTLIKTDTNTWLLVGNLS